MNRKEVNEIKKNFTENSGFLTTHRILTAYIDAEKNVRYKNVRSKITMPEEEYTVLTDTLKKVLSPSVGKALCEYDFPREAYDVGGAQNIMYSLLQGKLEDETANENFLLNIAENINYSSAFAVITCYCSYTVRKKNKMDEYSENADEDFNFTITAFCNANTGDDGFVFDEFNNELIKKENKELIVSKSPSDGFLYPVFSDRSSDINKIMYFTKTPNKPNISIVNDILGCQFLLSAIEEKIEFQNILKNVVGEELNYMVITTVNEKIQEIIHENKNETEPVVIDDKKLYGILSEVGVSNEKLTNLENIYKNSIGEAVLNASNLVESKTVLTTPDITVNIKKSGTDKVRINVVDNRRCLLIDLDDPMIEINGLPTNI